MERYFKTFELAYELGVSQQTVSRWMNSGKLEFVQLSTRRRVIPESAIKRFLDAKIIRPPQKLLDPGARPVKDSGKRSLKTEDHAGDERKTGEKSSKHWRKEINRLCQSN